MRRKWRRKAQSIDPRAIDVLTPDTTADDRSARVVLDYGDALIEAGSAVGGTILELDLRYTGDEHRVDRLGFATFAD